MTPTPSPEETPGAGWVQFSCGVCQTRLRVPSTLAGVSGPCPSCGATIAAPQVEAIQARNAAAPVRELPRDAPRVIRRNVLPTGGVNRGGGDDLRETLILVKILAAGGIVALLCALTVALVKGGFGIF